MSNTNTRKTVLHKKRSSDSQSNIIILDTNICIIYCDPTSQYHKEVVAYVKPKILQNLVYLPDVIWNEIIHVVYRMVTSNPNAPPILDARFQELPCHTDDELEKTGWIEQDCGNGIRKHRAATMPVCLKYCDESNISKPDKNHKHVPKNTDLTTYQNIVFELYQNIKNDPTKKEKINKLMKIKQKCKPDIIEQRMKNIIIQNDCTILATALYLAKQNPDIDVLLVTLDNDFTLFAQEIHAKLGIRVIDRHLLSSLKP